MRIDDYKRYERSAWAWSLILLMSAIVLSVFAYGNLVLQRWGWVSANVLFGALLLWQSFVMLGWALCWRRCRKQYEPIDQTDEIPRP